MGSRLPNLAVIVRAHVAATRHLRPSPIVGRRGLPPLPAALENHWRTCRRWHSGHVGDDDHHHHSLGGGGEEADRIFRLGLAADAALAAAKAATGYITGSTAIIADAAHSLSDVVLSGVALWSFRAAKAPRDKEHPYGHGKFESLGALGISAMLFATAGGIAWHAVEVLQGLLFTATDIAHHTANGSHHDHGSHHPVLDLNHPVLALGMTIISISVKEGLYWISKTAGEREGSGLMKANAWHHRADAVSSVVALIGVGGAILGVPLLDPFAGVLVACMIAKAGVVAGYQSILELVDAAVPQDVLEPIKQTIMQVEGVLGCHRLRGRKAGSSLYLDVHIEVDPFLSVSAAHEIGEIVRRNIQVNYKRVAEVFIHIDPSYLPCSSHEMDQRTNTSLNPDADSVVFDTISSFFPVATTVEHVTRHTLEGRTFLVVHVSIPGHLVVRDAMSAASAAEKAILVKASHLNQVSIQVRLGSPMWQGFLRVLPGQGGSEAFSSKHD